MAYTNSNNTNKTVRRLTKKERLQRWRIKEEARAKAKQVVKAKHQK